MARLNKRRRLEKRQRALAIREALIVRSQEQAAEAKRDRELRALLPKSTYTALTGKCEGMGSINSDFLQANTHYKGFVGGKSMGSGNNSSVARMRQKATTAKGANKNRFLGSFMAPGHEKLKDTPKEGVAKQNSKLIKLPPRSLSGKIRLKEKYQKDW